MADLFTQRSDNKELFHTDVENAADLREQAQAPSDGSELLNDTETEHAELLTDGQSSQLDLPDDELHEKNYITGTNTPRASRAKGYADTLQRQSKDRQYESPLYRNVDAVGKAVQGADSTFQYQDDFDTDSAENAGLHAAAAQTVIEGNALSALADSAYVMGGQTKRTIDDLRDGTIDAKEALRTGGDVLRMQGGKSVMRVGSAAARSTERYISSFRTSSDDFADNAPGKIKDAAMDTGHFVGRLAAIVSHPIRNLAAAGKILLIAAAFLLFLILISLLGQMSGTTVTSVLCAEKAEDIQTLVQKINDYRNEAITAELYQAFKNDVDPNGNSYGYDTLTGQRSNNLQHGVTWNYANGIFNDTAEIISMAAVYYQQDWPTSEAIAAFSDTVPFTQYCRALTAYGLQVTAQESAPYSCISYGGCVNGYRSEGETVEITDYRLEWHECAEGKDECGAYDAAGDWRWNDGHAENAKLPVWKEDGTHEVTVYFPLIFPDGATKSELCNLPDSYAQVVDGKINAADCTGSVVLDEDSGGYSAGRYTSRIDRKAESRRRRNAAKEIYRPDAV